MSALEVVRPKAIDYLKGNEQGRESAKEFVNLSR